MHRSRPIDRGRPGPVRAPLASAIEAPTTSPRSPSLRPRRTTQERPERRTLDSAGLRPNFRPENALCASSALARLGLSDFASDYGTGWVYLAITREAPTTFRATIVARPQSPSRSYLPTCTLMRVES